LSGHNGAIFTFINPSANTLVGYGLRGMYVEWRLASITLASRGLVVLLVEWMAEVVDKIMRHGTGNKEIGCVEDLRLNSDQNISHNRKL